MLVPPELQGEEGHSAGCKTLQRRRDTRFRKREGNAGGVPEDNRRLRPRHHDRLQQNLGRTDKTAFSRTLGITQEYVLTGRTVADPYQILKRDPWVKFHRYDLNTVAKLMLNEQKHDIEYGEMGGLWNGSRGDLARFVEYCRKDSDLSMRLL